MKFGLGNKIFESPEGVLNLSLEGVLNLSLEGVVGAEGKAVGRDIFVEPSRVGTDEAPVGIQVFGSCECSDGGMLGRIPEDWDDCAVAAVASAVAVAAFIAAITIIVTAFARSPNILFFATTFARLFRIYGLSRIILFLFFARFPNILFFATGHYRFAGFIAGFIARLIARFNAETAPIPTLAT